MNDYKELIVALKCCFTDQKGCYRNCFACPYEPFGNDCEGILLNALNAIEQLVKERDAAIKDLKYLPFTTCKWVNTDRCKNSCLCERYEWRGVQENIGNGEVLNDARKT